MDGMSFNSRFKKSREQRFARIAKQQMYSTNITPQPTVAAEEVPLADEVIEIEQVTSVPVEQPEQVIDVPVEEPKEVMIEPEPVPQPQRSTQNILDSIVGMLFAQHHKQIHGYMVELEKQILTEQNALLEKTKT
jgi:outer membrane biosynthesis protein TonB